MLCTVQLPDGHALALEVAPAGVHLVQAALQHEGVVLGGEAAQQLPPAAVERREHVLVALDLRLQVLEQRQRQRR